MPAVQDAVPAESPSQAVIFDLGGVVLDWRPLDLLERFYAGQGEEVRATVQREVLEHADWLELDRGTLSHAQAGPRFAARASRPADEMSQLLIALRDSLQPIPATVALLRSLAADGVPLYCLSNMHAEIAAWVLRSHDFWPVFHGIVFSADEKLIKPEPEIFQRLLRRYGLAAERTAFVDDHPANVDSARRIGLHAIAFRDAGQCAAALRAWLRRGPQANRPAGDV